MREPLEAREGGRTPLTRAKGPADLTYNFIIKRTDPPSLNAKASQIPVDAFEVSSSRFSRGSEQSYDLFSIALIELN